MKPVETEILQLREMVEESVSRKMKPRPTSSS